MEENMPTQGQMVPPTPREKYEALKMQAMEKGRWSKAKDLEIRDMLGLPAFDSIEEKEVAVDKPQVKEQTSDSSEYSLETPINDLRSRAKELGISAAGSKKAILDRIKEAESVQVEASDPQEEETESVQEQPSEDEQTAEIDAEIEEAINPQSKEEE